ncbi:hypothetical protein ES332_D08G152100v1 [Gossypium tomentosum]|uniref:Uncharacterized protein n=1 Tax=Gossypium tomentosum TaxID=34277 RepID=A0A5D2JVB3_GOSTO|nr:hypothetical protein ES332_D08G152100v1 [Gossypium tomentosum]
MRNICSISLFSNSSPKDCFLPLSAPHRNLLPYSTPIQTTHSKGIDGAPPLLFFKKEKKAPKT